MGRMTWRWGFAVALSAWCAGCTSGFVYNRLDTFGRWYIGNLVTLDDAQESELGAWLQRSLAWHRENELGRYEAFVRQVAARAAAGPDAELAGQAADQAEQFVRALAGQLAPEAAQLLLTLRGPQLNELFGNLAERDGEEIDEETQRSDAERVKRRTRAYVRNLERWTGDVTAPQRALIERTVQELVDAGLVGEDAAWAEGRENWRRELRAAVERGGDGRADVEKLLANPESAYPSAHLEEETENRRQMVALLTRLDASLSPRQRAALAQELEKTANQIRDLSRGRTAKSESASAPSDTGTGPRGLP